MSSVWKFLRENSTMFVFILLIQFSEQFRIGPDATTDEHYGHYFDSGLNRWEICHCQAAWDIPDQCKEFCHNSPSITTSPKPSLDEKCEAGKYFDIQTKSCDSCVCELMKFDMPKPCEQYCSPKQSDEKCEAGKYFDFQTKSCDSCVCELMKFDMPKPCEQYCSPKHSAIKQMETSVKQEWRNILTIAIPILVMLVIVALIVIIIRRRMINILYWLRCRKRGIVETGPPGGPSAILGSSHESSLIAQPEEDAEAVEDSFLESQV